MKVISFKICPFVQRVTALLEAKDIPYQIEFISLSEKPEWFLDMSPNGQVPVLITDEGRALFESDAIVEYLEEAYPALQPGLSPEDRAINRAWSYLASKNYLVQCGAQRSPDEDALQERSARLGQAFDRMEAQLGEGPYFGGEMLGMVDIAWLPLLHRADIVFQHSGYDFVGARPRLKAWQGRLLRDDLAARSVAPDFVEVFSAFYLSDETFLGRGQRVERCCVNQASPAGSCC
ncbi:MAG: glutathione S-transferase family protein [Pseudomonadota bacterium]